MEENREGFFRWKMAHAKLCSNARVRRQGQGRDHLWAQKNPHAPSPRSEGGSSPAGRILMTTLDHPSQDSRGWMGNVADLHSQKNIFGRRALEPRAGGLEENLGHGKEAVNCDVRSNHKSAHRRWKPWRSGWPATWPPVSGAVGKRGEGKVRKTLRKICGNPL